MASPLFRCHVPAFGGNLSGTSVVLPHRHGTAPQGWQGIQHRTHQEVAESRLYVAHLTDGRCSLGASVQ
eukprot:5471318-Alexandrium_andersonii.AAC.1